MSSQAYAQSKQLERLIEHPVSPLLVFSRASSVGRSATDAESWSFRLDCLNDASPDDAPLWGFELLTLKAHVMAALARADGSATP